MAAVDFVGWYNAHPHFEEMTPDLSTGRAIVVGNGNVALDVARILVSDPDVLANTDIANHALESLHARGVEEVVVIGRRGPLQATFTTLELRELGDLEAMADVDVIVDPADFADITDEDLEAAGKTVKQNVKVMRGYAEHGAARSQAPHRVSVPDLTHRDQGRRSRRVDRARPQRAGRRRRPAGRQGHRGARGTARAAGGARRRLPRRAHSRVCRSTRRSGTIPHTDGRIDGSANEYVVGWIKRGPSGVIGSNKKDSQDDGQHAARGSRRARRWPTSRPIIPRRCVEWLLSRQPKLVTDDHWKLIDDHERSAGEPHGQTAGQADERRRTAADQPRLIIRRRWFVVPIT